MHVVKPVSVTKEFRVCNRCGREMDPESNDDEYSESVSISFRAGYGSVFGDGNYLHGDFCQHCIQEALGKYLRVQEEQPLEPQRSAPRRAYQPYQLEARLARDELTWVVAQVFEKIESEVARQLEHRRQSPQEISNSIAELSELMSSDRSGDLK